MSNIAETCMILNLRVGHWQGYRLDKEATARVTREADAADDAARVNKHLVPKDALKPIVSAISSIRLHYYDKTLPWRDNGDRLLPRKLYQEFIVEHSKLVEGFDKEVANFLRFTYPQAVDRAAFRMGHLFKPDDYPHPEEIRRKFYVELDIDSVSQAHDFRLQQDGDAMQKRVGKAMRGVWERLAETLNHFATKMGDEDAVFRDTTVTNLRNLVAMLPALNVLNDPDLDQIREDIERRLVSYEPNELRKKPDIRSAAAIEAAEIMDQMKGFMTAFGGA